MLPWYGACLPNRGGGVQCAITQLVPGGEPGKAEKVDMSEGGGSGLPPGVEATGVVEMTENEDLNVGK